MCGLNSAARSPLSVLANTTLDIFQRYETHSLKNGGVEGWEESVAEEMVEPRETGILNLVCFD